MLTDSLWRHQAHISICTGNSYKLCEAARHCEAWLSLHLQEIKKSFQKNWIREFVISMYLMDSHDASPNIGILTHQHDQNGVPHISSGRLLAHCRQLPQLRMKGTATLSPTWPSTHDKIMDNMTEFASKIVPLDSMHDLYNSWIFSCNMHLNLLLCIW